MLRRHEGRLPSNRCWLILAAGTAIFGPGCTALHLPLPGEVRTVEEECVTWPHKALFEQIEARRKAAREASLASREYDLTDLLAAARSECGEDETGAKDLLANVLVRRAWPLLAADRDADRFHWSGTTLTVLATPEEHGQIAANIAALREQGLGQVVVVETRFVTIPMENYKSIIGNWSVSETTVPEDENPDAAGQIALDDEPRSNGFRAMHTVVERYEPVVYKVLDQQQASKFLQLTQGDRYANILEAPQVYACSGELTTVADRTEQPFLVGIKDGRPQVRVIPEGTMVCTRPWLLKDGRVRLECQITLSQIGRVEEATFPADAQTSQGIPSTVETTIQVPEVDKLTIEGVVEMSEGQTLLVTGLKRLREGRNQPDQTLALMLTPRLLLSDSSPASPSPSEPRP
jgi:hypothetical protein